MWRRLAAVVLAAVLAKVLDGDLAKVFVLRHPRHHHEVVQCPMVCGE
jgi:hypothetical protein